MLTYQIIFYTHYTHNADLHFREGAMLSYFQLQFHRAHEICVVFHVCYVVYEFAHKAHVI